MTEKLQTYLYYLLAGTLIFAGIFGGGYFCCVSASVSIVLMVVLVYLLVWQRFFLIACDMNLAAIVILVSGYFLSVLWAVDSGMSLMGGIKFLPVFLYFCVLCQAAEQRERLIRLLPVLGSLMTVFSFVMMQFQAFEAYVSVAGRLAGFFQYPNTYAVFLLVCLLVSIYEIADRFDWLQALYILIDLAGIWLSGSRTVAVLTVCSISILLIFRKKMRKYLILLPAIFMAMIFVMMLGGYGKDLYSRFVTIAENASTFWGRFLYDQDAVRIMMKYPFGMGYHGYYFVQQEMQTGVYSVVSAHNEFFQIMLDIGILPALAMYGAILKTLFSKETSSRDRWILSVLLLHSLFDYDFQFLAMCFVLLLFLRPRNIRKFRIGVLTQGVAVSTLLLSIWTGVSIGLSDFYYLKNDMGQAVGFYGGNTMARIALLDDVDDAKEMEEIADRILESNAHVPVAYSAKARAAFSEGDVEAFIRYKKKAIQLAPYQYEEYTDYLNLLDYCVRRYLKEEDVESAKFCVEQAEEIPQMLADVEKRTSALGWKIKDRPQVRLSHEDLTLIEDMRSRVEQ